MKTPILGSAYVARSINAADNRMVNLFPEVIPEGGKEPGFLNRAPGLKFLASVGFGPIRGLWAYGQYGYCVSGPNLYRIDPYWTVTLIGPIAGDGPVSMADNGIQLFIACNPQGYIYNNKTQILQQLTDSVFPGAVTVGYLDGYFVFNQPNSQLLWITSLFEGTSIDALDFASAEGAPDNLVSLIVDHRELWLFGTNSVEVWYDSGTGDFPLTRIQGAFNEIGCAAAYSVAKLDNALFWLGSDARGQGIVYRANGYTGTRVSTHAIEYAIAQYGSISDAIAYTYQQEGHAFYVLNFPSSNATWVYDVSTQAWHERAGWENSQFTRHRSNCQMSFNNQIVVGDFQNSNLYTFDLDVYADNGQVQKWLRSWRALATGKNDLKRSAHHSLQLDAESGVGLSGSEASDNYDNLVTEDGNFLITEDGVYLSITSSVVPTQGVNPQVILRWSDDGGHTWSNGYASSMGKIGEYGKRIFWRRLGMTLKLRDRVYEVSGTDPVKIAILGAELFITATNA
tara:strand:+ start:1881 stop:3413 length:1533 start_codon:yes stop_codon:yes gene_type:complete